MSRFAFAVPAIVLFISLVVWGAVSPQPKEERVRGIVLAAEPTYCEPRRVQGCSGKLTLGSQDETLTIRIPLGTPITAGCDALAFGELPGRRVVVTEVEEPGGPVAKAISALDVPQEATC
ncbi:MAG TPA: hypothetical protein VF211_14245 [Burkholderiales bacterium]